MTGYKEKINKTEIEDLAKYATMITITIPIGGASLKDYSDFDELKKDLIITKSKKIDDGWCVGVKYFYLLNDERMEKIHYYTLNITAMPTMKEVLGTLMVDNKLIIKNKATIELVEMC